MWTKNPIAGNDIILKNLHKEQFSWLIHEFKNSQKSWWNIPPASYPVTAS